MPADEWSDTDVLAVTIDPARWLQGGDWTGALGTPVVSFTEPTSIAGVHERRVLLDDGTDLDLIPFPVGAIADLLGADGALSARRRDGDVPNIRF